MPARALPLVTCPRCRSTRSRVYKTDPVGLEVERHRQCLACWAEWVTGALPPREYFKRMKAPLRKKAS